VSITGFMDFANVFLDASSYIKNPYLRAKFVEVLFWYTPDIQARVFSQNVDLSSVFDMNQKALKYLAGNLMKFFVGEYPNHSHLRSIDSSEQLCFLFFFLSLYVV
jgi:ubiquitin conjugation factor E4 B